MTPSAFSSVGERKAVDVVRVDVDEPIQPVSESRAIGARITHRRWGASFKVLFAD